MQLEMFGWFELLNNGFLYLKKKNLLNIKNKKKILIFNK